MQESASTVAEIDFSESFWGSDDVLDVFDRIFDGRDIGSLSTVKFNPFLSTLSGPLINATLPFLRAGNVLSGVLEEGDSLTLQKGNYTTEGSLTIDGTLVLEAGVTVKVGEGATIAVQLGKLDAQGTVEEPIVFNTSTAPCCSIVGL